MCMLCRDLKDFSLEHMEQVVKKLASDQIKNQATDIKKAISYYEGWISGGQCDGFEEQSVRETIDRLRQAQYVLNRHM